MCKHTTFMVFLVFVCGCQKPPEAITLDTTGIRPSVDYTDLAFVLERSVTEKGLLIPEALAKHADRLDRQLKLLAVTGPTITPEFFTSDLGRLVYWYNARTAWAMKLALLADEPDKISWRDMERPFGLDGRAMSLSDMDDLLAAHEDWRVLAASPGATLYRCRMPDKPFAEEDFANRLAERINGFLDDQQRLIVDVANRRIEFPPVLWRYRQRLIDRYHRIYRTCGANLTTALLGYTEGSAHRRLQDAIGYRCVPTHRPLRLALFKQ